MQKLLASVFVLLFNSIIISQTFDSSNVIIIDNGVCADLCSIENYIEVSTLQPQTFCGRGAYYGEYRVLSASGPNTHREVYVQYKLPIPADDLYILYVNLENFVGPTYFTLQAGENRIDSLIFSPDIFQSEAVFSWHPIGIYNLSASDSFLTVERGLDSTSSEKLRIDAAALVRSTIAGPDIELGIRSASRWIISEFDTIKIDFYSERAGIEFPATINEFSFYAEETIDFFNFGTEELIITDITFGTNVFTTKKNFPIRIAPGNKNQISVGFMPNTVGVFIDSIFVHSNDAAEPIAKAPLYGEGVNYNFILNASENGTEPHWNVPDESGTYVEVDSGWYNSIAMYLDFFPFAGKNKYSRIKLSNTAEALFSFVLPDSLEGEYFMDGSPFPSSSNTLLYKADIYTSADTFTTFYNPRIHRTNELGWSAIGDTNETFDLPAGAIQVRFYEPINSMMRLDLLRFRKKNITTESEGDSPNIISSAVLYQNYPNPFNPITNIRFDVPIQTKVRLAVYDILGAEIKLLVNEIKSAGSYNISFYAADLPSGIYFYRLSYEGIFLTKKMMFLK